jgi:phage terminase large subunit-like protein
MSPDAWGRAAVEMALAIDAEFIAYETNYGGSMIALVIRTAWDALRKEDPARFERRFVPRLIPVNSRKGKLLRAEPIGQQWKEDRCRTGAYLPDLESEWATWAPGGDSPGRIDASVHLAYELLPLPSVGDASMEGVMTLMDTNLLGGGLWGR